jgi:hypothetical protein
MRFGGYVRSCITMTCRLFREYSLDLVIGLSLALALLGMYYLIRWFVVLALLS